jgi:hypothetical protein
MRCFWHNASARPVSPAAAAKESLLFRISGLVAG